MGESPVIRVVTASNEPVRCSPTFCNRKAIKASQHGKLMVDHAVQPGVVTRIEKPHILRERGSSKRHSDRDGPEAVAVAKSRLRQAWYGIRHHTLCEGYGRAVTRWLYPLKSRMFVPISRRGRSPSTWLLRPDPSIGHGPGSNNPSFRPTPSIRLPTQ